jgi:hypothetical protein
VTFSFQCKYHKYGIPKKPNKNIKNHDTHGITYQKKVMHK